jgi:hypothetical protein
MIKQYPSIKRLRPTGQDWNEVLQQNFHPWIRPPIWTTKLILKLNLGTTWKRKKHFFCGLCCEPTSQFIRAKLSQFMWAL